MAEQGRTPMALFSGDRSFSPHNSFVLRSKYFIVSDLMYGGRYSDTGPIYDNITYQTLLPDTLLDVDSADYILGIQNYDSTEPWGSSSTFMPIPELILDNAYTGLLFLSAKNIQFLQSVDDDWYSTTRPGPAIPLSSTGKLSDLYYSDRAVSVLGCLSKRQVCDTVSARCSPLGNEDNPSLTWSSEEQEKIFNFWMVSTQRNSIGAIDIPLSQGINSLKAHSSLFNGLQGALPSDQWQQEVISWMSTSLADTQQWATGDFLQLQRMAHEELGLGTWSGASSRVPLTNKNETLGILDVSNEMHPIMVRPTCSEKRDGGSQRVASRVSKSSHNPDISSDHTTPFETAHDELQINNEDKAALSCVTRGPQLESMP
ncbi:MAG: hypothetical protein Q9160_006081 [Pyrenula sp. 1 TL-2023]